MRKEHGTGAPEKGAGHIQDLPDFRWPYKIAGDLSEWLGDRWEDLKDNVLTYLERHGVLRWTMAAIIAAVLTYLLILWCCFC